MLCVPAKAKRIKYFAGNIAVIGCWVLSVWLSLALLSTWVSIVMYWLHSYYSDMASLNYNSTYSQEHNHSHICTG